MSNFVSIEQHNTGDDGIALPYDHVTADDNPGKKEGRNRGSCKRVFLTLQLNSLLPCKIKVTLLARLNESVVFSFIGV